MAYKQNLSGFDYKKDNAILYGDCLSLMETIPDCQLDLILADLPFGLTKNEWDIPIPPDKLWRAYKRIIKPNGAILLHAQGIFSAKLILSNDKWYRYDWIWEKTSATGYLNAKRMPLRAHEQILVFYKKLPVYNYQKTVGHIRKTSTVAHKRGSKNTTNYNKHAPHSYDSTERYPRSILKYPTDKQTCSLHPTQKPTALLEYLIKTYTNEGDIVLDNCAGSGTAGIACLKTNRRFILMENDKDYYDIIRNRIENHINDK